jgi:cyclic beta-1,2-glucan synthetase
VIDGRPLSKHAGAVLDPIFSLRRRIRLAPGSTARIAFWTLVAPRAAEVLDLADKHHDPAAFERALTLAWTQAQVQLYHLGIDADEANLFQRLAGHVLYSNPALRPSSDELERSEGGPIGALGARYLRRFADRFGSHRRSTVWKPCASYSARTNTGG